jgi:predicted DNA-binding protein (MmcQ/YjbR family)
VNKVNHEATRRLRAFAFGLPDAWEDHPWDESVAKVGKKVFVFFGHSGDLGFSVKLPESAEEALTFPWCEKTGYGLGKAGWVSVGFPPCRTRPPVEMFLDWIEESYRAIAPKKLVAKLDAGSPRLRAIR